MPEGGPRIALDVDGVLADVMSAWLDLTNPGRLAPLSKSDMDGWDFWARHGIKKREFYAQLDACWDAWASIPPTEPDLGRSAGMLSKIASSLDIVTARSSATNRHVKEWLRHYDITYDRYVQVASGWMKADLEYDVFIDDSPINAEAFARRGRRVVLYDQPWNAGVDTSPEGIVRSPDLERAVSEIRSVFGLP